MLHKSSPQIQSWYDRKQHRRFHWYFHRYYFLRWNWPSFLRTQFRTYAKTCRDVRRVRVTRSVLIGHWKGEHCTSQWASCFYPPFFISFPESSFRSRSLEALGTRSLCPRQNMAERLTSECRHVHCPFLLCKGKATIRCTELRHWSQAQLFAGLDSDSRSEFWTWRFEPIN